MCAGRGRKWPVEGEHNGAVATVLPTPPVPVLIFGTHIAALGVLRALAKRGIESYVVDAAPNIIVRSRWYRPAERTLHETSDSDELAGFLRSLQMPRAVLIACSDQWTLAVAGLPPELRGRYPASVAPREAVEQFVDKDRFRALVGRLGIPHPRTLPIGSPADLDLATDDDLANGFLKPTESHRHNRRFGTKGFFVHSRDAAIRLVEQASAAGITFMLQEWIPGNMSKTILIDGFVDRAGTIVTMVARRRVRMDPPKIANTASDVTIPLAEVSECIAALRILLAEVAYRGIFNVEFKFDERDGLFKIIEVNPRPFWLIGHIVRAGVDLPWMSYLDAQELPIPAPTPYQIGRYGLYEIPDGAAMVRAWSSFHRPEGPVLEPWLKGDHALFWWSDPMPALADVGQILKRRVGRTLGQFRRSTKRGN
jgi:D-aspartate ligase